jgi:outer membrane immunogenic protein
MKKLLLAISAALVATAPALAADIGGRSRPAYGPDLERTLFNWSGFYVGVHGGWGWGSGAGLDPSGYLLGAQAGVNFQMSGPWVAGVETDLAFTGIDDSGGGTTFGVDYLGTVRGRVGYTMDRFMFYGTAGLAYGGGELTVGGLSNKKTHFGWTLGAGVEAFLMPNVTARVEYLFADLGEKTYTTVGGPMRIGFDTSLLRAGMNYKF